jgi:Transposase DDE domain
MSVLPSLPAPLGERAALLDRIEYVIRDVIEDMEPAPPSPRGRGAPAILPELCLWAGMLICILRGFSSQRAIWRVLTLYGLWDFPRVSVSDAAIYDRLARSDDASLTHLFVQITQILRAHLAPYADQTLAPFAPEVMALDESVLEKVMRHLPTHRQRTGKERIPGKLAALFDLRRQQWCRAQIIDDAGEREQLHARDLVSGLPGGSLILADLGYFGFAWFDDLTDAGYWWVSRLKARVTYEVIHTFYDDGTTCDALIWLGRYRADRARYAVRLMRVQVGATSHTYVTNVLDPRRLPLHQAPALYARRWDIELAIKVLKRDLNLHRLWSAKPAVLHQQVWATLIIAQVLLALWVEVAGRAEVDVFDVSLSLLITHAPLLGRADHDPVATIVAEGRRVGIIRSSRRVQYRTSPIPPEALQPPPLDLVLVRPGRYATGQGSQPITPASTIQHHPPPARSIPPAQRGRHPPRPSG